MRPAEAGEPAAPSGWVEEQRAPGAASEAPAAKPRLLRAVRRGLRAAYDYLGTVLVASALWIAAAVVLGTGGSELMALAAARHRVALPLFSALGGVVAAGIGTGPLTIALFEHMGRLYRHDDPYWWEMAAAAGRLWRRGLALAALQVGASLVMLVDGVFFLSQRSPVLRLCGAAFVYPLLFWWGSCLVQWPLAVDRPNDSLLLIVKKSFLLFLDNLTYCCLFAASVLLITLLCFKSRIGLLVLTLAWAGTLVFLQTAVYRELLPKYGLLAAPEEPEGTAPDTQSA